MYLITAVINKDNLGSVLRELFENHIEGVTVTDVVGKGAYGVLENNTDMVDLFAKTRLDIVVSNVENREIAFECIRSSCQDLGRGAGKMWWLEVGGVERIRTGEKDIEALTTSKDKKIKNVMSFDASTALDTPCS